MYWSFSFLGVDFGVFSSGSVTVGVSTTGVITFDSEYSNKRIGVVDVLAVGFVVVCVTGVFTVVREGAVVVFFDCDLGGAFFGCKTAVLLAGFGDVFLVKPLPLDAFLALALLRPQSRSPNGSKRMPREAPTKPNKPDISFSS